MKRLMTRYALTVVLAFGTGSAAYAADLGTNAGTSVSNSATVNYQVGGINQTPEVTDGTGGNSSPDVFVVDRKIDVVVADAQGAYTDVTPGSADQVLTFTVTNKTNDTIDINLSETLQATDPYGGTETFDAGNRRIFVDANGNNVYEAGTDVATFIDDIAEDASITVFILADIDIGQVDGDISSHNLVATAADSGTSANFTETAGADTQGSVDNVFADASGTDTNDDGYDGVDSATYANSDGKHSDDSAYRVRTATLAVVKSSRVISDPVNGTTNPKRIPGAVIEYCVTVTNSGSTAATSVDVTDDFSTEPTTQVVDSVLLDSASCTASDGVPQSDATGDDDSEIVAEVLTATKASVAGSGGTFRVQFRVTVD